MSHDIYQTVTDRIVAELETGAAPWVKPWKDLRGAGSGPHNAITRRPYSGVNVLLLWITAAARGYTSDGWLTFKQVGEAGGHVRKGEKATQVVFVKPITISEKGEDGKPKTDENGDVIEHGAYLMRGYYVFNTEQCDGLPARATSSGIKNPDGIADPEFDDYVARTGAIVKHGGNRACYAPSLDQIAMPVRGAFATPSDYKATLLHELSHWTGHKSRLDRNLRNRFGEAEYAMEEMIAELSAAYLCAELGVDGKLQHASYIDKWLAVMKKDKKAIFTAASAAQKAADFIRAAASQEAVAVAA